MKLGVIADDFTGASDIALTIAEAGMSVTQLVGVPTNSNVADIDAAVISLKSRTAPVDEAISESLAACDWLVSQGAEQIVLKVCSTFDSTSDGNIGPVLEVLAERLGAEQVLVCPAFPENGRSVYQGHLFVNDVLLNESGMQDHPLTPMKDSDIRRVLGAQTTWPVSHIATEIVSKGEDAIRDTLPKSRAMVIVDAIHDSDLMSIGMAARDQRLLCGGSGIALGLPANFGFAKSVPSWSPMEGKGVVISGSCSRATRGQVALYRQTKPSYEVTAEAAVNGDISAEFLRDWVLEQSEAPLVYSSAEPDVVRAAQNKFGSEVAAQAIESLFSKLTKLLVQSGVKRIVVAGGETSGAVVKGLNAETLVIGPRAAAGVPIARVKDQNVAVALKSGNFGDVDFFETALALMETGS